MIIPTSLHNEMTKLTHSYSALKQFDNCPKQYQMQRVTREVKPTSGEASLYGERIHKQLEKRLRGETLLDESIKYEVLCQAFEKLTGELLIEQELTLNKNLKPTGWWDEDAWLRSKLDVLVLNKHKAIIADWKTGKYRPDYSQLELFALQIFKHYPQIEYVKTNFIWLKDMRMDTQIFMVEQAPALWDRLLTKIHRVEAALEANNWPAKPSGLCPWCPAKHLCEFSRI